MKLLTFLGTNRYKEVTYSYKNKLCTTRFIQRALAEILPQSLEVIVYLTDKAYDENWMDGVEKGLESELKEKGISYQMYKIKDGKDSNEVWENFNIIYDSLDQNDRVIIDITHSLRSIPILINSVINYAKVTKNIKLLGMYYGAYEAKDDQNIAPIFDLTVFENMNQWNMGVKTFLTVGNGFLLENMIEEDNQEFKNLKKQLKEFTQSIGVIRGLEVGEKIKELKKNLNNIKDKEIFNEGKMYPLKPLIDNMEKILENIDSNDFLQDIHEIIKLCVRFGLIQQAYTLLRENIVTYGCKLLNYDIEDIKEREKVEKILNRDSKSEVAVTIDTVNKQKKFVDKKLSKASKIYIELRDFRNDLNHAGFRQDTKSWDTFIKDINGRPGKAGFIDREEKLIEL